MLSFLAVGDWGRRGSPGQRAVAAGMQRSASRSRPDFVISTGDNFRDNGVVGLDDRHFEESFETVYRAPELDIPWYAALGNDDYRGDVQAQIAYTRQSTRWRMPSRYYARRFRALDVSAIVAVLDTTPFIRRYQPGGADYVPGVIGQCAKEQLRWLDAVLGRCEADWKIVVGHHPLTAGERPASGDPDFGALLAPLLDRHNVHAYISGHENALQHIDAGGRHFLVTGAGSDCASSAPGTTACGSFAQLGFASVRLSADAIELALNDVDGRPLHQAESYRRDLRSAA